MKTFWKVLAIVLGLFMIFAGVQHFLNPQFYSVFVPSFLPFTLFIIYASGVLEILIGLMLLISKYRYYGAWAMLVLMLIFLPIHIADVFSETPAIGSKQAAYIRLPVQFLLIALAWKIKQLQESKTNNL